MAGYPSLDDDPSGLAFFASSFHFCSSFRSFSSKAQSSSSSLAFGLPSLTLSLRLRVFEIKATSSSSSGCQTFVVETASAYSVLQTSSYVGASLRSRSYRGRCIRISPVQYTISYVHLNSHTLSVIWLYMSHLIKSVQALRLNGPLSESR